MSSALGHLAAGTAAYLAYARWHDKKSRPLLAVFTLLAVLPDFDYFALWLFKINYAPRLTHSLLFCLSASAAAWFALRSWSNGQKKILFAFSLASCSHPLLDLLVGVHPVPIF